MKDNSHTFHATTRKLMQILMRNSHDFYTRRELYNHFGITKRDVRLGGEHARGGIISTNKGLKLTEYAQNDEIEEAIGRMWSQINANIKRIHETEKAAFKHHGHYVQPQLFEEFTDEMAKIASDINNEPFTY